MYASVNALSKSEFRKAVQSQLPVVLWSPVMGVPAVEGTAHVEGPWPGTKVPQCLGVKCRRGCMGCADCAGTERVRMCAPKSWHAEVVVRDMMIVEVH